MIRALAIRILWVLHDINPKPRPGLCPPQCQSGHTYEWPCRAKVR